MSSPTSSLSRPRPWLWFFVALAFLGSLAITIPLIYNLKQQLRPEQLDAARQRWREKGPRDYTLDLRIKENDNPDLNPDLDGVVQKYRVQVRSQVITSVTYDGRSVNVEKYKNLDIPGLFDRIADFLRQDTSPGRPRTYAHALFDPVDGHPIHYVRRVMGSRQRLEIIIQLRLPGLEKESKPPQT